MKKTLLTIVLTVLACSLVMGATLALLIDKTGTIQNTFVAGDINITLTEEEGTLDADDNSIRYFKMIPGSTIPKDPTVTVKAGSEACYLFVYVVPSTNFDTYMTYEMAEGWTAVDEDNYPDLYYRTVGTVETTDISFSVLKGDQVEVIETLTKDQLTAAKTNVPTISFMAFAVQLENVEDVADAVAAFESSINSGS